MQTCVIKLTYAKILDGPGIDSRWGDNFHTRLGRGIDRPPPRGAEVKERVELYLYYSSRPSWPILERTLAISRLLCDSYEVKFWRGVHPAAVEAE